MLLVARRFAAGNRDRVPLVELGGAVGCWARWLGLGLRCDASRMVVVFCLRCVLGVRSALGVGLGLGGG